MPAIFYPFCYLVKKKNHPKNSKWLEFTRQTQFCRRLFNIFATLQPVGGSQNTTNVVTALWTCESNKRNTRLHFDNNIAY